MPIRFPREFLVLRIITNIRLHPFGLHQAAQFGDGGLLHGFVEQPHFLEVGFGFENGLFIEAPLDGADSGGSHHPACR